MATTTANQGIRVPEDTDDPDIVDDLTKAVQDLEKISVMKFTSTSNRDTKVPSPTAGMFCITTDTGKVWYYTSSWVQIYPASFPTITSGSTVPGDGSGANGDIFLKV